MENEGGKRIKRIHRVRGAITACLILAAFTVGLVMHRQADRHAYEGSLPPGVFIDGMIYTISRWDTSATSLPDGFAKGGIVETTTDSGGYISGCQYYTNPVIPEWVYVYGKVWDERGNASMSYIRFVLPDIRHNTFIRYDGQVYVQLFGYSDDGEDQEAFYRYKNKLKERYGYRIETETPEGCTLVGSAHCEELDRIPQTEWGVNDGGYDGADVYADPDNGRMLYVGTSWHTATAEEMGDTLHSGYDVFVLCEPEEAY